MPVIQLATPQHFTHHGRVERIGLHRNQLFVAHRDEKELEVWSVHCLVPCSWQRLFHRHFHELFYARCAVSSAQNAVFVLVAAFFDTETRNGGICIYRYDLDLMEVQEYGLDPEEAYKFEEVTLERVRLGCGQRDGHLFLHDLTMVTGQIPFWRISLNSDTMTFSIESMPILDNQKVCEQCTRFPVFLDGDQRSVLRITNDHQVFVYDGNTECWELFRPADTAFDWSRIPVRGISETFGHNWHRFSAIESKLSIFSESGCCIFKVFHNKIHHFYRFKPDFKQKCYTLEQCSSIKLETKLETLCFVHCSENRMAFINKHLVGFVPIQPPSLRDICFWRMQKQFASVDQAMCKTMVWSGGKTSQEIQKMFNINKNLQIVE